MEISFFIFIWLSIVFNFILIPHSFPRKSHDSSLLPKFFLPRQLLNGHFISHASTLSLAVFYQVFSIHSGITRLSESLILPYGTGNFTNSVSDDIADRSCLIPRLIPYGHLPFAIVVSQFIPLLYLYLLSLSWTLPHDIAGTSNLHSHTPSRLTRYCARVQQPIDIFSLLPYLSILFTFDLLSTSPPATP
jgi:hypothetical protein